MGNGEFLRMDSNLKLFELVNDNWIEVQDFSSTIIVGEKPIEKTICFSPNEGKIYGLQIKLSHNDDIVILGDLSKKWTKIIPDLLKQNEKSAPIKIQLQAINGSYRMSAFDILAKYLQGPNEE